MMIIQSIVVVLLFATTALCDPPFADVYECGFDHLNFTIKPSSFFPLDLPVTLYPVNGVPDCVPCEIVASEVEGEDKPVACVLDYKSCNVQAVTLNAGADSGGFYVATVYETGANNTGTKYSLAVSCYYDTHQTVSIDGNDTLGVNDTIHGGSGGHTADSDLSLSFNNEDDMPASSAHIGDTMHFDVALKDGDVQSYEAIMPVHCYFSAPGFDDRVNFVEGSCPLSVGGDIIEKMERKSETKFSVQFKAFKIGDAESLSVTCTVMLCQSLGQCNDTESCWGNNTTTPSDDVPVEESFAKTTTVAADEVVVTTVETPAARRKRQVQDQDEPAQKTLTRNIKFAKSLADSSTTSCSNTFPVYMVLLACLLVLLLGGLLFAVLVLVCRTMGQQKTMTSYAHQQAPYVMRT